MPPRPGVHGSNASDAPDRHTLGATTACGAQGDVLHARDSVPLGFPSASNRLRTVIPLGPHVAEQGDHGPTRAQAKAAVGASSGSAEQCAGASRRPLSLSTHIPTLATHSPATGCARRAGRQRALQGRESASASRAMPLHETAPTSAEPSVSTQAASRLCTPATHICVDEHAPHSPSCQCRHAPEATQARDDSG
jgi:hypothetical protein